MKLLLVEDDREIREMLSDFLSMEGYEMMLAGDGEEALRVFDDETDLVLLDLMLPKKNGLAVMREIRKKSVVPILILTAKDSDSDITLGLGMGADDYITKPFSVTEVLARIKANLRRATRYSRTEKPDSRLKTGDLEMDLETYTVRRKGEAVELTAKEFEILKLLMQNPKRVYTKEQMYSLIWKDAYLGDENAVNVHISRLRNKIEENPRNPRYVLTVWGIGYKLGEER